MKQAAMSVMMSVMAASGKAGKTKPPAPEKELPKEFTVRDMNRNTALVLAACRQHGRVIVKHRGGEQFEVRPVGTLESTTPQPDFVERMRRHRERMRELGARGPTTPEGIEHLNRIIAGET